MHSGYPSASTCKYCGKFSNALFKLELLKAKQQEKVLYEKLETINPAQGEYLEKGHILKWFSFIM